jgi:hypothetical protein
MKINKKRKINLVILIAIALVVMCAGYAGAAYFLHLPPFVQQRTSYQPGEQVTNLKQSDTEKAAQKSLQENPEQKLQNSQTDAPSAPTQTTASGKQSVNVSLTSVGISNGVINASGMVTNIVEDGGVCTYVFTNGVQSVSKTSVTSTNPTSTTCTRITFSADELPLAGTWTVKINYSSPQAEGVSNEKEITK